MLRPGADASRSPPSRSFSDAQRRLAVVDEFVVGGGSGASGGCDPVASVCCEGTSGACNPGELASRLLLDLGDISCSGSLPGGAGGTSAGAGAGGGASAWNIWVRSGQPARQALRARACRLRLRRRCPHPSGGGEFPEDHCIALFTGRGLQTPSSLPAPDCLGCSVRFSELPVARAPVQL